MRRSGFILTAFILVILLVAAEVFIIRSASNYEPKFRVLFAKEKITARSRITSDMLEFRNVGLSFVHSQSVKSLDQAVSKTARTDIEKGEMILSSRFNADDTDLIEVKDKNKRLLSVEFKGDQANGWLIRKDQFVDILFIPNEKNTGQADMSAVVTDSLFPGKTDFNGKVRILNEIRIAALVDDRGKLLENSKGAALPKYVSFEVTNEQADFLAYAKSNGRLELSVIPGK
jgi:Flp pilus assembly protein CpaB